MGRHEAPVPLRRRVAGAVLGATVIVVLAIMLWAIWTGIPGEPTEVPITIAPPTSSTTTSTTSSTTTSTTVATTTTAAPPTTVAATTTPVDASDTTSTTMPVRIDLRADGLGAAALGDAYEPVRAVVDQALGPADSDTGWIGAESSFGTCPGNAVRVVRWDSLRLYFSDGPTEYNQDETHLFYYNQSTVDTDEILDLATPEGIALGSSVSELRDAYGDMLTIDTTPQFGPRFVVDPIGPAILSGTLSGPADDAVVTSIGGGFGCGG